MSQAVFGIWVPFYPLVLVQAGIPTEQITPLMALAPLSMIILGPFAGRLADRNSVLGLRAIAFLSLFVAPGYYLASGLASHIAVSALFFCCMTPMAIFCDNIAIKTAHQGGHTYASIRLFGAGGFAVATFVSPSLMSWLGAASFATLIFCALAATACASLLLDSEKLKGAAEGEGTKEESAEEPLAKEQKRSYGLPIYLSIVGLYFVGHSCYDSGFSLHMSILGGSDAMVGYGWAIAQASELVAFGFGALLVTRFGGYPVAAFCMLVAVGRWLLLAWLADPNYVLVSQVLHAVTIGLFQLSLVALLTRMVGLKNIGKALGAEFAVMGCGQLIGMGSAGTLLSNSVSTLYLAAAAAGTLSLVLFLLARGPLRRAAGGVG